MKEKLEEIKSELREGPFGIKYSILLRIFLFFQRNQKDL